MEGDKKADVGQDPKFEVSPSCAPHECLECHGTGRFCPSRPDRCEGCEICDACHGTGSVNGAP